MPDVSVVSGTYNRLPLLREMVESARKSAGGLSLEIVLVDGGSTDGTQDWAKAQPDVVLIEQGELLGAIVAYNAGCAAATGKYVVIGNDDITFDGDTILTAYFYLEGNPEVGQAAFAHRYQRREAKDSGVQGAYGYLYGQCCMTRKWLGDLAGWWGSDGMRTYGGDTRLGLRLWEMGWPVVPVDGCSVTDKEHQDALREVNSDSPWKRARAGGRPHPDLEAFQKVWGGRLPKRSAWIPRPAQRVVRKAMDGTLRSLRYKQMMKDGDPPRRGLVDALAAYGTAKQIVLRYDVAKNKERSAAFQESILQEIGAFEPDLVLFQAQSPGLIWPETVRRVREKYPWVLTLNWDGDIHQPLMPFHFEIARAVHLQLVSTPSLFPAYAAHGVAAGWWPIGIEREYLEAERNVVDGHDVVWLGTYYGEGQFPEATFRRDAVIALAKSGLDFGLYGRYWERLGLKPQPHTGEKHAENAALMARARMALSISMAKDLWGYSSDRLYNITATGCPALVQRFAGMEEHGYVDGQTCIAFDTVDELVRKARHYVAHDDKREAIGAAGRAMTHERHTWVQRVEALWSMMEGLGGMA